MTNDLHRRLSAIEHEVQLAKREDVANPEKALAAIKRIASAIVSITYDYEVYARQVRGSRSVEDNQRAIFAQDPNLG